MQAGKLIGKNTNRKSATWSLKHESADLSRLQRDHTGGDGGADAIQPFLDEHYGNPSSSHIYGLSAQEAVAEARASVAELIHANPNEIVFTGSATESNNLALLGIANALGHTKRHLIVSAIEHPAVMQPALHLREIGWDLTMVPVDGYGRVDPYAVAAAVRPNTALVSIMHANNEVGTTLGVDLLTLAGHKFYATKGIGALYVRSGTPIKPILYGADQEHGLRPGTGERSANRRPRCGGKACAGAPSDRDAEVAGTAGRTA